MRIIFSGNKAYEKKKKDMQVAMRKVGYFSEILGGTGRFDKVSEALFGSTDGDVKMPLYDWMASVEKRVRALANK